MEAIVFDCDGVLVDSEIIARRVVSDYFGQWIAEADLAPFLNGFAGKSDDDIAEEARQTFGVSIPPDYAKQLEIRITDALEAEVQPIPGAAEAVAAIPLPRAVASNSVKRRVELSLSRTGLSALFDDRLFCADMTERPKPAPDLYLMAAAALGVPPDRCVVVEDSPTGVQAAVAAGMTVIGFLGGSHILPGQGDVLRAHGAVDLVHKMDDLPVRVAARRAA